MTPRRDLHRAVDGELSKKETRKLEADPRTKAELDRLKAVAHTPREVVRPVETPTGFKKKVLDEIRRGRGSGDGSS
jgi:anti-sigma factor RsiW